MTSLQRRVLILPGVLALTLAGDAAAGCGGCYSSGSSSDVQVMPASLCLTVTAGRFDNGCGGGTSGIVVSNACSGALTVGGTTVLPGEANVAMAGNPPASGARRTLTGTLDGTPITISWQDAAERTTAPADMGTAG
jgi:hypothetical protein